MKWHQHPAVWIGGSIAVMVYLCAKGKLPVPLLCKGVEGVKDPRLWQPSLSTGNWLFGGGRDAIGKQLTYLQPMPFTWVNSFNPLEIKQQPGTASGPVGQIIDVKTVNGDRYALVNASPLGDGIWTPIIPGYAEPV